MGLFFDLVEWVKVMGVFGFVMFGGGALGVLFGGVLIGLFLWYWIFLVNVLIGVGVWLVVCWVLFGDEVVVWCVWIDVFGAVFVIGVLMLLVYGIVISAWVLLVGSVVLLVAFVLGEFCIVELLVLLWLFWLCNVVVFQAVGVLWVVVMFVWFFLAVLYF